MNRSEWRSVHRTARLGRRRDAGPDLYEHEQASGALAVRHHMRPSAVWAFTVVALIAATVAFWRVAPGQQGGQALAVSVPAASTPAAAESASSAPS